MTSNDRTCSAVAEADAMLRLFNDTTFQIRDGLLYDMETGQMNTSGLSVFYLCMQRSLAQTSGPRQQGIQRRSESSAGFKDMMGKAGTWPTFISPTASGPTLSLMPSSSPH